MRLDRRAAVVIEHVPFRAQRGPLHDLAGLAGKVEQHDTGTASGRQRDPSRLRYRQLAKGCRIGFLHGARGDERGDQPIVLERSRSLDAHDIRGKLAPFRTQARRCQPRRDVRTAVGPAAANREIHPQSELASPARRERDAIEELGRQVRVIVKAARGVVDGQRINGGDLEAADAAVLHAAHFRVELLAGRRGTEPPPPHHDAAVVRWLGEEPLDAGDSAGIGTRLNADAIGRCPKLDAAAPEDHQRNQQRRRAAPYGPAHARTDSTRFSYSRTWSSHACPTPTFDVAQ